MANKAKKNPVPLVPLSVQARRAIVAATERIEKNTRQYSMRRRLEEARNTKARLAFRDGNYAEAIRLAGQVAP